MQSGNWLPMTMNFCSAVAVQEENPSLKLGLKKADNLSRKSGQKKAVNPYRK